MQRSRYGGAFENRFPGFDGYKLTELSEELQIRHENPHRADSDAEVTA